uniref:Uncharacterized protein n=1 Tax=Arundo donax TaxID=35708 RepID=A0A0A9B7B3_ARUDO
MRASKSSTMTARSAAAWPRLFSSRARRRRQTTSDAVNAVALQ